MSVVEQTLPTGTWQADPVHSTAGFRVKHFGVSTFRASFGQISATYTGDGDEARLAGVVPVESISITQPDFRGHVLSEEFFDAEKHPELRFESTSIRREGDGIHVDGEITIKGITRPISARGTASEPGQDPYGADRFAQSRIGSLLPRQERGQPGQTGRIGPPAQQFGLESLLPYRAPHWCVLGMRGWWRCGEGRDSLGAMMPR